MTPNDVFVIQKLALATYKSKQPTPVDALNEACHMLEALGPANSTDTETLGLYGAVHKRLWDETKDAIHLDKAIWSLEKGFYVKNDYYNGINLAYMLNVRAAMNADTAPAEAIADFILAERTRRQVLRLCEAMVDSKPAPGEPTNSGSRPPCPRHTRDWAMMRKRMELLERRRRLTCQFRHPDPKDR